MPRASFTVNKTPKKKKTPIQSSSNQPTQNDSNTNSLAEPTLALQNEIAPEPSMLEKLLRENVDMKNAVKIQSKPVKRKNEQAECESGCTEVKKIKVEGTAKIKEPSLLPTNPVSGLKSMPILLDINDNTDNLTPTSPSSQVSKSTALNNTEKKTPVNRDIEPVEGVIETNVHISQPDQNTNDNDDLMLTNGIDPKSANDVQAVNKDDPKFEKKITNSKTSKKPKPKLHSNNDSPKPSNENDIKNSTTTKTKQENNKTSKKSTSLSPSSSPSKILIKDEAQKRQGARQKKAAREGLTYVAAGLQEDCENLVQRCLQVYRLNFDKFSEIWKEMNFVSIFSGRQSSAELAELSEEAIHIAKVHMLAKNLNFEENVAGLFLVYALLNLQPYKNFAALRLVPDDVPAIKYLEKEARKQRRHDVIYILGAVLIKGPCHCHVLSREVALELQLRKYFDGSIQSEAGRGVLTKTCETAGSFRDVVALDQRYADLKAQVAARFPAGQLTVSKQIGLSLLQEFRQLVSNVSCEPDLELKLTEITPPPQDNRHDTLSSIKEKAMLKIVDPMRHLTGIEERQKNKLRLSPQKTDEPKSKNKGKGKGKGTGRSKVLMSRGSAVALNSLFEQPSEEVAPKNKKNSKLGPILDMTDDDLEKVTSPKRRFTPRSPKKEDECRKRKNSDSNFSFNIEYTAKEWLNKADKACTSINTDNVDESSKTEQNTSESSFNTTNSPIKNTPINSVTVEKDVTSEHLNVNQPKTVSKQKHIKKTKKKQKPEVDSDSDIDSDEIDKITDKITKTIQNRKSLDSDETHEKPFGETDSDDPTVSSLNRIERITEVTSDVIKDKLEKIIATKVKQKTIVEASSPSKKRKSEIESPRRNTRSMSLNNSPIKAAVHMREKRLQKRDLKRIRVKSAFKRLGMLEVANFDNSSDQQADLSDER